MLLLALVIALNSCDVDQIIPPQEALLPIESVTMPAENSYVIDDVSVILVKYRRPTSCYMFNGFKYTTNGNTAMVSIRSMVLNQDNCVSDDETLYEVPLEFTPTQAGEYIFKFWIGNDESGTPEYLEHIAVVE